MRGETRNLDLRFAAIVVAMLIIGFIIALRLGKLQIMDHQMYSVLATDQHEVQSKITPVRGRILIRDDTDNKLYPLAANREAWTVYAVPYGMKEATTTARNLSPILGIPEVDLLTKLSKSTSKYQVLAKDVSPEILQRLKDSAFENVDFNRQDARLYPEKNMGGQVVGVVTPDDQGNLVGRYGIESSYQEILAGKPGRLDAEKDAQGRRLVFANTSLKEAINGSDVVLTLDRAIQYQACEKIKNATIQYEAESGTIIIMDPSTGAILAMCSYPDFEPSDLKSVTDVGVFNNPAVFRTFEPGSVFKAVTMAAGLDMQKVNPNTTYTDKGFEEIDDFKIQNSDHKAHGVKTMTNVLEESLNTGTIFVQRLLGKTSFRDYVQKFGFGKKTDAGLKPEGAGDISSLDKKGDVFAATASFGQGITTTPIQLISAYATLANQGKMMKPYIVAEVDHPDGKVEITQPIVLGQPVSARAARLVSGMLISVVENGHSKLAMVPGYWVAGKTGTAQVAKAGGKGYEAEKVIASFIGYAPANNPKFVMLVKFDYPKKAAWAESCAAPVFGDMAKYLLQYLKVKPER